jgi:hypothetical protein
MPLRVAGSAAREFRDVLRAATPTHRRLRDHLFTVTITTVGVDLFCAIVAFLLERHSQQTEIKTLGCPSRLSGLAHASGDRGLVAL